MRPRIWVWNHFWAEMSAWNLAPTEIIHAGPRSYPFLIRHGPTRSVAFVEWALCGARPTGYTRVLVVSISLDAQRTRVITCMDPGHDSTSLRALQLRGRHNSWRPHRERRRRKRLLLTLSLDWLHHDQFVEDYRLGSCLRLLWLLSLLLCVVLYSAAASLLLVLSGAKQKKYSESLRGFNQCLKNRGYLDRGNRRIQHEDSTSFLNRREKDSTSSNMEDLLNTSTSPPPPQLTKHESSFHHNHHSQHNHQHNHHHQQLHQQVSLIEDLIKLSTGPSGYRFCYQSESQVLFCSSCLFCILQPSQS